MLQQQFQRKQKSFALQRGLYILRYENAPDPAQPPMVAINCEPGRNEAILHPDQQRAVMTAPGQSLVIRAYAHGNVHIELSAIANGRPLDAMLKFEPLMNDPASQFGNGLAPQQSTLGVAAPIAPAQLRLLGHVARLGDVMVGADEWLGGPAAPSRIEGFQIVWPGKPSNVSLRYAATVAGQRPGEARTVEVGEFVGSRGKARPILGLMLELSGAGARDFSLDIESLFLSAPPRRSKGQTVTVTGATGREPLVGLRVSIAAMQSAQPGMPNTANHGFGQTAGNYGAGQQAVGMATQAQHPVAAPAADQRRVRVFRA